jgi:two-component system response regulator AtoC
MRSAARERDLTIIRLGDIEAFKRERFITQNKRMLNILQMITKIARVGDVTVLIEGETGTGKELVAEAIHYMSPRRSGPFVTLNSSAIPSGLAETELFGYEKGSFTGGLKEGKKGKFEMAHEGTLFLDEISELPLEAQTKLLRVLEEKAFFRVGGTKRIRLDVRVVAASNMNLEQSVKAGRFREDLFYRLNIAKVSIPPLRERKEDIIAIAMFYMNKFNQKFGRNFRSISEEAKKALLSHSWKGNVRELRNVMERVLLTENTDTVQARHVSFLESPGSEGFSRGSSRSLVELPNEGLDLESVVEDLIRQALQKSGGNKAKAARLLKISKPTLVYRLQKLGLDRK